MGVPSFSERSEAEAPRDARDHTSVWGGIDVRPSGFMRVFVVLPVPDYSDRIMISY